jgi:hypothetical protein
MCVILVCPKKVRPDRATLDACHRANPHGVGLAWREDGEVRWLKGLEPEGLEPLIAKLSGEIVIHFRLASVGEVTPKLCHPFPITSRASTRLSGHARAVLFHNGTWTGWRELLRRLPRHQQPDAPLSDTRLVAILASLCGMDMLERLPGRWVFFDRDFTELYGDWRTWRGMKVSNLNFLPVEADRPAPQTRHKRSPHSPDTCGNSDT